MACTTPIELSAFTWEAFATLATGLTAVAAAVLIGLRQAGIAHRQTEIADQQRQILAKQVDLDEFRLRSELFDRRFKIYEDTLTYIYAAIDDSEARLESAIRPFMTSIIISRLIFKPSVSAGLHEILEKATAFASVKRVLAYDNSQAQINKEHELRLWLTERPAHLEALFGDELKLGR